MYNVYIYIYIVLILRKDYLHKFAGSERSGMYLTKTETRGNNLALNDRIQRTQLKYFVSFSSEKYENLLHLDI